MDDNFGKCVGFQWDEGNSDKNWGKHPVLKSECEQVFFNTPLVVSDDKKHSMDEKRWYLLGRKNSGRELFIVFTVQEKLIRVISARDMNRKEREVYYEKTNSISRVQQ